MFPGSSLVKAQEQWKAMLTGQIDMSAFPLDYASGFHPQFGATLMPGLVKGHAHARRINDSDFMKDIKAIIEQGGVHVLADAWLAGAFGSKDKCIRKPEDAAGLKVRSAGSTFAQMWAGAGASIVSIPSSEVYSALQQGVAQATDTSTGSFVSFRLYEQLKCVTAPGDNALWFMYEPVLISKKSWDKLNDAQKKALTAASKKAEDYFESESKKLDDEMVDTYKKKEEQGRSRDPHRCRGRGLACGGAKDVLQGLCRQGARRQGTDRKGIECQVGTCRCPCGRRLFTASRACLAWWRRG